MKRLLCLSLALMLLIVAVPAKDIHISHGVSLADTTQNRTVTEKEVIRVLHTGPQQAAVKETPEQKGIIKRMVEIVIPDQTEYSEQPVTDAIADLEPAQQSMYKAEYLSRYASLTGTHTVTIDNNVVILNIRSADYDNNKGVLVLRLTASVNGISKTVINPYKIYNPPVMVQIEEQKPMHLDAKGHPTFDTPASVENPETAVISSVSQTVMKLPDGQPVFGTTDPTYTIYPEATAYSIVNVTQYHLDGTPMIGRWKNATLGRGDSFVAGYNIVANMQDGADEFGNQATILSRASLMFNTSMLHDTNTTVTAANVGLFGNGKYDYNNDQPAITLTTFAPASNTSSNIHDYETNGTRRYTYDIAYTSEITGEYNSLSLTPTGLSMIDFGKYTNMQIRLSNDTDNIPMSQDNVAGFGFGTFGVSTQPYLQIVYSRPAYQANFAANVTSVSVGMPVQFTDTSTGGDNNILWFWQFLSPYDNSTIRNPVHTFTFAGNYTISLFTQNVDGETSNITKVAYVHVYTDPHADFSATPTSTSVNTAIQFTDLSTIGTGTGLTCNWSFGDSFSTQPYSSQCGNVMHIYTYNGVYDVNLTLVNSNGTSYMLKRQYITISASQGQTTWYSPHQVVFEVLNSAGNHVTGATINATANGTSLPSGYLTTLYGTSPAIANDMLNGTLIMQAITGGDGMAVFTMHGSIVYDIRMTNPETGAMFFTQVMPLDSHYNLRLQTATVMPTLAYNAGMNLANTSLTFAEPNNSYVTMGLTYLDTSGRTTDVKFYVTFRNNGTVAYSQDLGNPGASLVTASYTTKNVRGITYRYNYTAVRL